MHFATFCVIISVTAVNVQSTNIHHRSTVSLNDEEIERQNKLFEENWFDQILDHHDATNLQTYKQRYFMSDVHYQNRGALFIQIGGEGAASAVWLKNGLWTSIADQVGARLYILEHRYYGKSRPVPNTSTKNLKYLSSSQALADLAHFIKTVTAQMDYKPKVIVWGGSYPGSLALWSRFKYPYLIDGAVAASAPLWASADFYQYLEVVFTSIEKYGEKNCANNVRAALDQTVDMLGSDQGRENLKSIFSLCANLKTTDEDFANFMQFITGLISDVVQYSGDNRAFEGGSVVSISTLCKIMNNETIGTEIQRYAKAIKDIEPQGDCADVDYQSSVASMKNESWDSPVVSSRMWIYQTCTEFGWYQTTDSKNIPWKYINMNFEYKFCQDVYGPQFTEAVLNKAIAETNTKYGALDVVNYINQTILINGDVDPWHAMSFVPKFPPQKQVDLNIKSPRNSVSQFIKGGISMNVNPYSFQALFIQKTAHCAVLYPPSLYDVPDLLVAREIVHTVVIHWVS